MQHFYYMLIQYIVKFSFEYYLCVEVYVVWLFYYLMKRKLHYKDIQEFKVKNIRKVFYVWNFIIIRISSINDIYILYGVFLK